MNEKATRDETRPWSVVGADDDETAFLPQVLAQLALRSRGATQSITRREAEWVMRVKRAAPPVTATSAWLLSVNFMRLEDAEEDTAHLDLALAIASALGPPGSEHLSQREADLIAAHVSGHAKSWFPRKLSAWAGSKPRASAYLDQAGNYGNFAEPPWVLEDDEWYIEYSIKTAEKKEDQS